MCRFLRSVEGQIEVALPSRKALPMDERGGVGPTFELLRLALQWGGELHDDPGLVLNHSSPKRIQIAGVIFLLSVSDLDASQDRGWGLG